MQALDRGLYLTQQIGLIALIEPIMRAWHYFLEPKDRNASREELQALDRRFRALLKSDLENVEAGIYPRDLLFDLPKSEYLKLIPRGVLEMPRIFLRRARKRYDDLPAIEHEDVYPHYYLRNFHWQTDGWLSDHSARFYDLEVEALFLGTAAVMRRQAIPPLVRAARGLVHPRILDVACGTGRFLSQVHRALPNAKLFGLDLSPHYIDLAKQILDKKAQGVSLVVDNAEAMPFKDQSFDAVSSIFLFHELPGDARRNVMREALRVLVPGGTFVICDSAQLSDGNDIAYALESFPKLYHEPYFTGYSKDDLGDALAEVGFEAPVTERHFVSKVVIAKKPA